MARQGLPGYLIKKAKGNLALAWRMKKAQSRKRKRKNPRRARYTKGTRARPTVISRGIKRGKKYTVSFPRGSSFACPKPTTRRRRRRKRRRNPTSLNPRHRRRRTTTRRRRRRTPPRDRFGRFTSRRRTSRRRNPMSSTRRRRRSPVRRRRRRNPAVKGILGTFKKTVLNPDTYVTLGAVGLGALGSVALSRLLWQQTVGRFAPTWSTGLVADVATAGVATAVGAILGRFVTKRADWRRGIMISAGVLASATLIRNLVGMVSPQAAGFLGYYGGAMPARSYVGDYVSTQGLGGVGDYVSTQGLGACNPALGAMDGCNPSMFQSYGGLGTFYPPLQEIPGEAMIY